MNMTSTGDDEKRVIRFQKRVADFQLKFLDPMIDSWRYLQDIINCGARFSLHIVKRVVIATERIRIITTYPRSIKCFLHCDDINSKRKSKWCRQNLPECIRIIRKINANWKRILNSYVLKQILAVESVKTANEFPDRIRKSLDECFDPIDV
jgi:hypothetical protein